MRMIAKFLAALGLVLSCSLAQSQDYPAREIRSICNFAAGSGADIIVRFYSDRLSKLAGKPVLVENKPGAQGTLASDFVAKSKPDGYTIMITPASSTLATAPFIFKKLPFDPMKDFAPVTTLASLSFVLAVDAAKPIRSIHDLVAHLKSKPNHGFYGTGSNTGQVAAELFKEKMGLSTVYVPYKVTVDALTGVVGGGVDFISYDATWAVTQHLSRIRILAVTAAKRSGALPDIPTLSELGLGEFDISPWFPRAHQGRSSTGLPDGSTRSRTATTPGSFLRARRSTPSPERRSRWPHICTPRRSAGGAGSRWRRSSRSNDIIRALTPISK
jgi:tripartite-type tricarboxylate transporter receptor subunit TctC